MVEVRDLEFAYGDEVVISSSSLSVEGPGLVTLLGPNGAGKTTFFKLLLGILKPLRGSVLLNGEDVTGDPVRAGVHASYVPQLSAVRRDLPMTALEAIEAALTGKLDGRERRERALKALSLVGAEQLAKRKLSEMSGGQLQRVMIARALARGTPILLMDE
ncbi:MAG: ATP-binding cassette domain-containing protein, partial [Thermofilaceae archaeon]